VIRSWSLPKGNLGAGSAQQGSVFVQLGQPAAGSSASGLSCSRSTAVGGPAEQARVLDATLRWNDNRDWEEIRSVVRIADAALLPAPAPWITCSRPPDSRGP